MPTQPALKPFKKELADYKTGKDTIQFPYNKALPQALIRKIAFLPCKASTRERCAMDVLKRGVSRTSVDERAH